MAPGNNDIYAATYSSVPVYEFNIGSNHVMRRRCDDYINATHILKVADYDKPARTRILEREVQKGQHEKIQGGYGKYQGTWIPLQDGRMLAQRNNVFEKLRPIFDYIPSNVSPPPAPKHNTNSSKPKIPKLPGVKKGKNHKAAPNFSLMSDDFDNASSQLHDDDSLDAETIDSASYIDGDDGYGSQYVPGSRKRKRGQQDIADQQHMVFADALLDYFILSSSDGPAMHPAAAPQIPPNFEINRPIDDQWHTALHWAVAMGDLHIVKTLMDRGANGKARNRRGETPLVRALTFTNNYEKDSMEELMPYLERTMTDLDNWGASVLHHTMMTTNSRARRRCALYYLDILLETLSRKFSTSEFTRIINLQDKNGDTALHIAAKYDAKKCVRLLQERGAQSDIHNMKGETADQLLATFRSVRQDLTSSPPQPDFSHSNGLQLSKNVRAVRPSNQYQTEPARSFSQSFDTLAQEKSLQIALALEKDYQDKDEALEEAQAALNKAEQERQQIHQSTLQCLKHESSGNEEAELAALQLEYETLVFEGQSYSEQLQHRELHRSIREAELALPKDAHFPLQPSSANGGVREEQILQDQLRAGLELVLEQNKRRKLTEEVVNAQGLAGMGPTGEALKRLVATSTGVPVEDVVGLAGELLEEMEAAKMDGGGAAVEEGAVIV